MPVAQLIPAAALGVVALILIVRSRAEPTRSGRAGGAAAGVGLAALTAALAGPMFDQAGDTTGLAVCGGAAVGLGLVAAGLAAWALRARRADGGALRDPVVGLLAGLVGVLGGVGELATGGGFLVPEPGAPRAWRSAPHGFELTVPSERWKEVAKPRAVAEFVADRPAVTGLVLEVVSAKTDAEFDAVMAKYQKAPREAPLTDVAERTGPNAHGRPHWAQTGDTRVKDGTGHVGVSVTRVGEKAVVLLFEATIPPRLSETARGQVTAAARAQAETFLGSVR